MVGPDFGFHVAPGVVARLHYDEVTALNTTDFVVGYPISPGTVNEFEVVSSNCYHLGCECRILVSTCRKTHNDIWFALLRGEGHCDGLVVAHLNTSVHYVSYIVGTSDSYTLDIGTEPFLGRIISDTTDTIGIKARFRD